MFPDSPRRWSVAAARKASNAGRRVSFAAQQAVQHLDILHDREGDNPLGIGINEIVRVQSVDYANWTSFNARRFSTLPPSPSAHAELEARRRKSVVRQGMSERDDDYSILRVAKHDDMELMSRWKRWAYRLSAPLVIITIGVQFLYFVLRIMYTRAAEKQAGQVYWMAWAFIVIEIIVLIPMLLHRLWGLHAIGTRRRPKLRIVGDQVPSVDVIITCCGEDDDLVLDTAKAACNIDYPRSRFRVIICDDGNSKTLCDKAERTAVELFDNLYYRSRPKYPGVPHHFKAGNLNYALDETARLPGGAANFFAALDADMIPERDWLRALIPHMLQDPKCCMTCPPQLFYNVPKDDPLCQSLDLFVHVSEPMKDSLGVAWCTGSGYIMRRAALESIGRFPTGSLAEDVCTSSMLLGGGWNTAFVHEPLQYGTVPDSLSSHLKQRTRWTIGTVQTSLKLRFCLWGPLVKRMTFYQRLCGFVYTIASLLTVALVASMFTSPIVLVSGGNLVPFSSYAQLKWLIRIWFASHVANRLNEVITYLPSGYFTGQREARAVLWMAIFQSISIVRTFCLPSWLGGKIAVFTSSGSQKAELDERDPRRRAPLWRRLKVTIWDCQCYLHLLYIAFILTAVAIGTYWNVVQTAGRPTQDLLIAVLTHAGWPPILWLTCLLSCWIPIGYAISPPDCPDREELLVRDDKTGVAYPREDSKVIQTGWVTWMHEVWYSTLSLYTCVVFALSFYIE
ncbi:glycosyl transferase [Microdochium bolleyi]|uniref:Glycosyl transferase n=1 Tax=Microdochium bolleyi TaxID=196109 RepID=A0A136INK8_9PEZI|nr:glycosyl transferase [Microdochium bolleyi]